jgi:hypothetical protein
MSVMGFMHADEALRLANDRQAGLRQEARLHRARSIRPSNGRHGGIRGVVARLAAALREVDVTPLPRLLDYAYRP